MKYTTHRLGCSKSVYACMHWLFSVQISANGKTTSLGDHDTEEQAATAFDRAAINKAGRDAKTNFPMDRYTNEIEDLQGRFKELCCRFTADYT